MLTRHTLWYSTQARKHSTTMLNEHGAASRELPAQRHDGAKDAACRAAAPWAGAW